MELRAPLTTSPQLQAALAAIRAVVPALEEDRYMATDLEAATDLVASGDAQRSVAAGILPDLEAVGMNVVRSHNVASRR